MMLIGGFNLALGVWRAASDATQAQGNLRFGAGAGGKRALLHIDDDKCIFHLFYPLPIRPSLLGRLIHQPRNIAYVHEFARNASRYGKSR